MKYVWAVVGHIEYADDEHLAFFDHYPTKKEQMESAGKPEDIVYDDYLVRRYKVKTRKKDNMHTCIGTVVDANHKTRKISVVFCDADQYTENLTLTVPTKFRMPCPVDDGDFLDKFGVLPKSMDRCHVKIGYQYAFNVKRGEGKFSLKNPTYLGEVVTDSCSSMNGLKRKGKNAGQNSQGSTSKSRRRV